VPDKRNALNAEMIASGYRDGARCNDVLVVLTGAGDKLF
jgi:enoyl-CoA hydratase/carnithine racemase